MRNAVLENRAAVHFVKHFYGCRFHSPLDLDSLYKTFFCCKSHVFENIIHLFSGPHNLKNKKKNLKKKYRRFTFKKKGGGVVKGTAGSLFLLFFV